jgi:copper chaperone
MTEAVYTVSGMSCDHCVHAVSTEVGSLTGVTDVVVELDTGKVRVTSDRPLSDEAVRAAVEEAGYQIAS